MVKTFVHIHLLLLLLCEAYPIDDKLSASIIYHKTKTYLDSLAEKVNYATNLIDENYVKKTNFKTDDLANNLKIDNLITSFKRVASEKYNEVSDVAREQKNIKYFKKHGIDVEYSKNETKSENTNGWNDWFG